MGPHKKHAEVILAWLSGKEIQYRKGLIGVWKPVDDPGFFESFEYRVKPAEDIVLYAIVSNALYSLQENVCSISSGSDRQLSFSNLKLTFDGDTKVLKSAEVI
jgi:hypothetical protein